MCNSPNCEFCKNNKPFDIPAELYEALRQCKLVVFAGAGISTEAANVYPYSFFADICDDLKIDSTTELTFPDVVTLFEQQDNGRRKLLAKIRDRVQYVKSFRILFNASTSFHRELADIHLINEIITTNWDDFFEIICDAIPFVIANDLAFWNIPERKVFKIHGSINNLSTIIASKADYRKCRKELSRGIIGSYLRVLLATKTIVYCGYSFNDPDFRQIHEILTREMKEIMPHAYIVTLDQQISNKIAASKITPIFTDATFFLHSLKEKLIFDQLMNDPDIYNDVETQLSILRNIHTQVLCKYDLEANPMVIYTYSFQDGLLDALERGLTKRGTGEYLCNTYIENHIKHYLNLMKGKKAKRKYWDVAYIEGYIRGLLYFITSKDLRAKIPFYYIMGCDEVIFDKKDFDKLLRTEVSCNSSIYKSARRIYKKNILAKDIVLQHTPFLF